ncbi:hypothetical protein [uncultured Rhodoblastus sp.]|uniref:hypothetical protein n=1 Tax=uncultured Rhodoblastus sp. TaxID=543037 RepID=UPI0025FFF44D|nr:hypothetical protein [uncultured Rhodoblastus sp.]
MPPFSGGFGETIRETRPWRTMLGLNERRRHSVGRPDRKRNSFPGSFAPKQSGNNTKPKKSIDNVIVKFPFLTQPRSHSVNGLDELEEFTMDVIRFFRETTLKERVALALSAFSMLAPLAPWNLF